MSNHEIRTLSELELAIAFAVIEAQPIPSEPHDGDAAIELVDASPLATDDLDGHSYERVMEYAIRRVVEARR